MDDEGWVRFLDTPGRVLGRFTGEYEGEVRELAAVRTLAGVEVWPASALIAISGEDALAVAARMMVRVVEGLEEAGLDEGDIRATLEAAIAMRARDRRRAASRAGR